LISFSLLGKGFPLATEVNRIEGFDMARAIAIMAMVLVNFDAMTDVNIYPWLWLYSVVEFIYGRAATLFVILAGVSLSLMAQSYSIKSISRRLRPYLMKRCLLLFITGTAMSYWWEADILHFYALFLALGACFSALPDRALWALTMVAAAISIPVSAALTVIHDMTDFIPFVEGQPWAFKLLLDYVTSCYYPVLPWVAFFMFGMLLGRREPANSSFHRRCLVMGTLIFIAIELFSAIMMSWAESRNLEIEGNWWVAFLRSEAFPSTPLFVLSSGAGALAIISLCRLLAGRQVVTRCLAPLVAFGRLSLTMYVAHLLLGNTLLHWIENNYGDYGEVAWTQTLNAVGLFCCFGICVATGWLRFYKRGPLETLFYLLARDRRAQPMALELCPAGKKVRLHQ
jgi:uncharacterized membrane protein YeiB